MIKNLDGSGYDQNKMPGGTTRWAMGFREDSKAIYQELLIMLVHSHCIAH